LLVPWCVGREYGRQPSGINETDMAKVQRMGNTKHIEANQVGIEACSVNESGSMCSTQVLLRRTHTGQQTIVYSTIRNKIILQPR